MNLKESPRRLWALIGAGAALLIVAAAYLLLISGQNSSRADLESQSDSARQVAATSHTKLLTLQQDAKRLPQYKSRLATLQAALPKTPASSQLLADMHSIARQSNVKITSLNVTQPLSGPDAQQNEVAGTTALPVTVAAEGTSKNLEKFVGLLQSSAARAVQVGTVSETVPDTAGDNSQPTVTVSMKAFFGRG